MNQRYTQKMIIGEIARSSPQAKKLIEKYFGKDCFRCPSFDQEALFMGARQHNLDIDVLLRELNSIN